MTTPLPANTHCIGCNYDLAGLTETAVCPECALPCINSRLGDTMYNQSRPYLKRLATGTRLVMWACALAFIQAAYIVVLIATGSDWYIVSVSNLISALALALSIFGWFKMTSQDNPDRPMNRRTLGMTAMRVLCVAKILSLFMGIFMFEYMNLVLGWTAAAVVGMLPIVLYLSLAVELTNRAVSRIPHLYNRRTMLTARVACHVFGALFFLCWTVYIADMEHALFGGALYSNVSTSELIVTATYASRLAASLALFLALLHLSRNLKTVRTRLRENAQLAAPPAPPAAP